jgi:hypothetical protein
VLIVLKSDIRTMYKKKSNLLEYTVMKYKLLAVNLTHEKRDPLIFWTQHHKELPILFRIVRRIYFQHEHIQQMLNDYSR